MILVELSLLIVKIVLDIKERLKKTFFKLLKLIPQVRKKIDTEMDKVSEGFEMDVKERTKHLKYITRLPEKGLSADKIIEITDENLGLGKFLSYLLSLYAGVIFEQIRLQK